MIYTKLFAEKRFQQHEQWIPDNLLYETIMGSNAYGNNNENSDIDIVSIVMPKEEMINPYKYGYIIDFENYPNFKNKECKGEKDRVILENGKPVEAQFVSLIYFFYMTGIKGSPNLFETLFVRENLITFNSKIGSMLRDNRKLFLSTRTFNALKGYTYQQIERVRKGYISGKSDNSTRQELIEKFKYDVKGASHPIRLINYLNQLLDTGDIDLMQNKEECKSIRNGTWGDFDKFVKITTERLEAIENKFLNQKVLSINPQSGSLKVLLQNCIEEFYGSESNLKNFQTEYISTKMVYDKLDEIAKMLRK